MPSRYRPIVWTFGLSSFLLGVTLFLHVWRRVPLGSLTRDPNAIGGLPFHAGFLSQVGLFLWAAAAAVCLFCFGVVRGRPGLTLRARFFLASGALTLLLGLDDAFQLHELVFPALGIPQNVVLAGYAFLTLGYLVGFSKVIFDTEYAALGIALAFFAVSATLDVAPISGVDLVFYEDGAKLVGNVAWVAYFFSVGAGAVSQPPSRIRTPAPHAAGAS